MPNVYSRALYTSPVPSSGDQAAGDLSGLLQQVMLQNGNRNGGVLDETTSFQQPTDGLTQQLFNWPLDPQSTESPSNALGEEAGDPSRDPYFRQLISRPLGIPRTAADILPTEPFAYPSQTAFNAPRPQQNGSDAKRPTGLETSEAADIIPAGGFSVPSPGRGLGAPWGAVWPHPRDQDVAELWKALKKAFEFYTFIRRGAGGGGGGGRKKEEDEESYCEERARREINRCYRRVPDATHRDWLDACITRARTREIQCTQNRGMPKPGEPPEWGDGDEEIWRNFDR
ncbi:hypothetical protein [Bradyrhizobium sp. STM 3843]|uniref:hypothetical protein n=1 Tax=Bradyrhizobium sp. STM 3843 TaxID=551947 RepID=UPI0011126841|nr:hypothetical protein [Bradyrhizobium sp. STM 3843]